VPIALSSPVTFSTAKGASAGGAAVALADAAAADAAEAAGGASREGGALCDGGVWSRHATRATVMLAAARRGENFIGAAAGG
jgi:hypothetical protein